MPTLKQTFNQVLQLVASGIQLATANTQGAAVQVFDFLTLSNTAVRCSFSDTVAGGEDQSAERDEAANCSDVNSASTVVLFVE